MPVDEPVALPNIKARTEMRENIHLVRCLDRQLVVIGIDVVHDADVIAVIEEHDLIEGHARRLPQNASALLDLHQLNSPSRRQRGAATVLP